MTQILLDANSVSKLSCVTDAVEICDLAGRVIGRFVPAGADDFNPRDFYPLVDQTMAEDDANDPYLESYQSYTRDEQK